MRRMSIVMAVVIILGAVTNLSASEMSMGLGGNQDKTLTYGIVQGEVTEVGKTHGGKRIDVEDKEGEPFTVIVTGETYTEGEIQKGVQIEAVYDLRLPMLMIYPPQYDAEVVRVLQKGENTNIKVDKFTTDKVKNRYISEDKQLVINTNKNTKVVSKEGKEYKKEIEGCKILVEYKETTRSIPPQTTPKRIVVLEEKQPVNVKIGRFEKTSNVGEFISKDGELLIKIKDTEVVSSSGKTYTWNIEERPIRVEYTITTRSLPPQTVPEKIIVMTEKEYKEHIKEIRDKVDEESKGRYKDILKRIGIEVKGTKRKDILKVLGDLVGQDKIARFEREVPGYMTNFNDIPEELRAESRYLGKHGVIRGIGEYEYGSERKVNETEYATMLLRLLGYDDSKNDFYWKDANKKLKEIGFYDLDETKPEEVLREGLTIEGIEYMTYNYLYQENRLTGVLGIESIQEGDKR